MHILECPHATEEAKELYRELKKRGLEPILEYWDEYKHVDMCIREARLFIEVDGPQHKNNYNQRLSDLERDYWSRKKEYKTLRFTNEQIKDELELVIDQIVEEVYNRVNTKKNNNNLSC